MRIRREILYVPSGIRSFFTPKCNLPSGANGYPSHGGDWPDLGSVTMLADDAPVRRAVRYVVEKQGGMMAVYVHPELRSLLSR